MKTKFLSTIAFACCFMICLAMFADLSGKWTGKLLTPDGNELRLNYEFNLDGNTVVGTGSSQMGKMTLTDGKVDGSNFTFNVDVNGVPVKNICKYYADGDSISLILYYNEFKMHSTLTRDKGSK